VEAYLLLAQQIGETKGKAYNIGAGKGNIKTTKELVWNIIHLMDSSIQPLIVKKESPFLEIPYQYLSSEKIRKLGWAPKVSLDEGLRRNIQWYQSHLEEVLSIER